MSSEHSILALYGLFVIVVIVVQVLAAMGQVGLGTLANPRDDMPKLTGVAGRLERAHMNSVVAMALFAPAILLLSATGGFTAYTLLAAQVFLIARVLYVIVYAMGTPWLRTLIWACGFLATAYLYLLAL
jgi:uncharacterized MAPEG superfamily protein